MKKTGILCIGIVLAFITANGQEQIVSLWPKDKMPNYQYSEEKESRTHDRILRIQNVQHPDLNIFLPQKNASTKKAIIICPGGGYGMLAYDWEGTKIAQWFTSKGFTVFVLKYRLPGSASIKTRHLAPLQDVQRAIRWARSKATQWNINPNQIGIIGFSAGGHLAASSGTLYEFEAYKPVDLIDSASAKPDFMALIYPVITMKKEYTHQGSKDNLLGKNPEPTLIQQFSAEANVDSNTPPTFIVHAKNDKTVLVKNSIQMYEALKKHNVSAELIVYPKGGHGFALAAKRKKLGQWKDQLLQWIDNLE